MTFEYDALGRRVARSEGSATVVYFQADQQTIADYPCGGAASTATYRYVFASYIDERYSCTAYGQPTILTASLSILATLALANRYTYTAREWDAALGLHCD